MQDWQASNDTKAVLVQNRGIFAVYIFHQYVLNSTTNCEKQFKCACSYKINGCEKNE